MDDLILPRWARGAGLVWPVRSLNRFSPGCNCCGITPGEPCSCCETDTTPSQYEIVVSTNSLAANACTQAECDGYEGTYILWQAAGGCTWSLGLSPVCAAYPFRLPRWVMSITCESFPSPLTKVDIYFMSYELSSSTYWIGWEKTFASSTVACDFSSESIPYNTESAAAGSSCKAVASPSDIILTAL